VEVYGRRAGFPEGGVERSNCPEEVGQGLESFASRGNVKSWKREGSSEAYENRHAVRGLPSLTLRQTTTVQ
jgi:hypothetical protein